MCNSKYFLFGGTILFLILILASCNWPGASDRATETAGGTTDVFTPAVPAGPTNTDGAETILIPGGQFWMGSDSSDSQADADESPRHQVTLDGFYIYTHEVTNEMYARCVAAGGCMPIQALASGPTSHYDDPAYADHPVVGVDWLMARDYCVWAGGRLPTEAEWELAARGTESLRYPWGSEPPACDRVNMFGCQMPPDTMQVGSYALGNSPYGVWDMAGNVWEWVNDWYDEDYYVLSPASNPLGPYYGELKVARGGGLYSEPVQMRAAARVGANPHRAYDDVGFRCVAAGEALPPGYIPPPDYHEFVPPGGLDDGGETLEEPDRPGLGIIGPVLVSCPDPAGNIHLFIGAVGPSGAPITAFDVQVNGAAFTCYYDDALRGLQCSGPAPLDYDTLTVYDVRVYVAAGELDGSTVLHPPVPHDCPTGAWPPDIRLELSCPSDVDGTVLATFTSSPPIRWDRVQYLEGMSYLDAACMPTSPSTLLCVLPGRAPGELYSFSMEGQDDSGFRYSWWTVGAVPEDCPSTGDTTLVMTACFEGDPRPVQIVGVVYPPGSTLESVSADGAPLTCFSMGPDSSICGPISGAPGSSVTVTVCLGGGSCSDWPITVLDCAGGPEIMFDLRAGCFLVYEPAAELEYWPCESPLASAQASGTSLTCMNVGPCHYICTGLPGDPGTLLTFDAYLRDGSEIHSVVDVSLCGSPPGGETPWQIVAAGCHDDANIYFIVDTGLSWLTPGAVYTYTARDEIGSYSCSVHPTIPGRLYCVGPRRSDPGRAELCLQPEGGEMVCQSFDDFPAWIASIPACGTEPPPELPPPPFDCSIYSTNPLACDSHPECRWEPNLPPNGACVHR